MTTVEPIPAVESIPQVTSGSSSSSVARSDGFLGPCGMRYEFTLVTNPLDLIPFQSQWQELAARAADPNPFYEDWFFLPAARALGRGEDWKILLIHAIGAKQSGTPELCGFFPFVKNRSFCGLSEWTLWKNSFCYLTSPLIDQKKSIPVLRAAMHYIQTHAGGAPILNFPMISGEGPLHHAFTEILRENLATSYLPDQYLRAVTTCRQDFEGYLKNALGGHHMREYRRKRRKLESLGQLEYRSIDDVRGSESWVNWFLDLEATGWKARAGTAIQLHPEQSMFFREMIHNGLRAGKVRLEGLFLNGEPIALKCLLLARPAAFAFKIAFDESHHTCSPGVQLEFHSLERLVNTPDVQWCDSCAIPGHQMIDRLWVERRPVRHLMISTGRCSGEITLGALPLLRSLNRIRKRWTETVRRAWKTAADTAPHSGSES